MKRKEKEKEAEWKEGGRKDRKKKEREHDGEKEGGRKERKKETTTNINNIKEHRQIKVEIKF